MVTATQRTNNVRKRSLPPGYVHMSRYAKRSRVSPGYVLFSKHVGTRAGTLTRAAVAKWGARYGLTPRQAILVLKRALLDETF
jgi:hypothetical protein